MIRVQEIYVNPHIPCDLEVQCGVYWHERMFQGGKKSC